MPTLAVVAGPTPITIYINFDSNSRMAELFASGLNTDRLIMGIELYTGKKTDADNMLLLPPRAGSPVPLNRRR